MTYLPVFPAGGTLGWTFLQRTREDQQAAFDKSATILRATDHFRENIGRITSAEDLVADRRLLGVALGAFGLDDDIDNRFYIRKVLEEGTLDESAFANRLADKRYFALAEAFAFDLTPPNTALSDFADGIVERFQTRRFDIAVGTQDADLRLALGVGREIDAIADREISEDAAWFTVMGNPPVRRVFEQALGLPPEMVAIDIDRQRAMFRDKALGTFGVSHPGDFRDPDLQQKLVRNFLFRAQLAANTVSTASGSVALTLLRSQTPLF